MINNILIFVITLALIFLLGRKRLALSNPNVKNVSAEEANTMINQNKDVLILDVRSKGEYDNGHIPNAKLIPAGQLASRIREIEQYKDKPILVYCASGGRSPGAVTVLLKNSFSEIYHLSRGISSWTYKIKK